MKAPAKTFKDLAARQNAHPSVLAVCRLLQTFIVALCAAPLAAGTLWLTLAAGPATADTLTTKDSAQAVEGQFEAFRNDRFLFLPQTGKKMQIPRARVITLHLTPPGRVSVKSRAAKNTADWKLAGYEAGQFTFITPKGTTTLAAGALTTVQMKLDFRQVITSQNTPAPADLDIASLVESGKVTIVHFHMPSIMASMRQGSYAGSLEKNSRGKIKVATVTLDSFTSPVAQKYAITSAPQFWFYNPQGELTTQLVDRFTEADMDNAAKAAGK